MKDRVAIVTGAGKERGIGGAAALALAKKGAMVVVTDLKGEEAKNVANQLKEEGYKAVGLEMNVASKTSVQKTIGEVIQQFGKVDILVNNAGISLPSRILNITDEEWDLMLNINLKGIFYCTQAVLPSMIQQKYGRIVNTASVAGKRGGGVYGGSHYAASKAGVFGFSKAVAREMGPNGITVNSVAPGMVDTEILDNVTGNLRESLQATVPMGRIAQSKEIAAAIAFLASEEASYITGEEIDVNGGFHMD